jgi:hypothetical protein
MIAIDGRLQASKPQPVEEEDKRLVTWQPLYCTISTECDEWLKSVDDRNALFTRLLEEAFDEKPSSVPLMDLPLKNNRVQACFCVRNDRMQLLGQLSRQIDEFRTTIARGLLERERRRK